MSLRCGVVFGLRNPEQWRIPYAQLYADALELTELVDNLGYDSVWVSEHHFSADGYCASPLSVLAAMAARTRRVRLGTNILVLPMHHPLRIAEDAAAIDVISGGRFVLGVGAGYREDEFDAFGVPLSARAGRLRESIEILRRAWTEDEFTYDGEHFRFGPVSVTPKPVRPGGPPIYVGARTEVATRRAGRLADGLILSRGRQQIQWFHDAARHAGRDPRSLSVATNRIVYVADSADEAMATIGPHLLYHERSYQSWFAKDGLAHEAEARLFESYEELPRDRYILGTPEQVTERILQLQLQFGFDELIMWARLPGMPIEAARRSLERFGREVLPQLHNTTAATPVAGGAG